MTERRQLEGKWRGVVDRWRSRLWLAFVVLVSFGIWKYALLLNPAKVPSIAVIALGWLWLGLWWRVHHELPALGARWFGPRLVLVLLAWGCAIWSLAVPILRDDVLAVAASREHQPRLVLTGVQGDRILRLNAEVYGGLLLDEITTIEFPFEPAPMSELPDYPTRYAIERHGDSRLVTVSGDGRYLALFEIESGNGELREIRPFRFDHDRIAAMFGSTQGSGADSDSMDRRDSGSHP